MANERINPYYEGLIESIKTTTTLIQELNKDLKSSEISQATLKARLDKIEKEVDNLNRLMFDGSVDNSIITKIALVEDNLKDFNERDVKFRKFVYSKVEELQESVAKLHEEHSKKKALSTNKLVYNREKVLNILKVLPGVVALITILIKMLI